MSEWEGGREGGREKEERDGEREREMERDGVYIIESSAYLHSVGCVCPLRIPGRRVLKYHCNVVTEPVVLLVVDSHVVVVGSLVMGH